MSSEHLFIFTILIFYGFLFLMYSVNGNSLYGLTMSEITFNTPSYTGNWFLDIALGTFNFFSTLWGFFTTLFITPFTASASGTYWAYFGFINWAIFGTMMYILFRVVRGGG